MLARAKEHFPQAHDPKMDLQEMDFHEAFDGAICMDAREHICPEDWPGIMKRFGEALKPGGLPVVFGELADEVKASYDRVKALDSQEVQGELADCEPSKAGRMWRSVFSHLLPVSHSRYPADSGTRIRSPAIPVNRGSRNIIAIVAEV